MIVGITGGRGFIGRRLVADCLIRGFEVRVLTRNSTDLPQGVTPHQIDLTTARESELLPFVRNLDMLFHCAGAVRDPSTMRALHVRGTRVLARAAVGEVHRWVQLSSVGSLGWRSHGIVTENDVVPPRGEYETTKAESDQLVLQAHDEELIDAVVALPSIVFAPEMPNASLRQLVGSVARNRFAFVGSAPTIANYVYVQDVVDALQVIGSRGAAGHSYIINDAISLDSFIDIITRSLGMPPVRRRVPEPVALLAALLAGHIPHFPLTVDRVRALTSSVEYSSDRLRRELHWQPQVGVESGLAECVTFWAPNARAEA